ncbi:MAG TPA: carotenoid biosynthesis protein [Calditrichia bacterium]|nr:carotenoid biosynthesis protein [Calditrichota bacterium]HQU73089.1 carotenoid biosynthesis protein [Calditrichia bacterium]HQV30278.1 carotenoid biosynthesis protein [Calditrichia bacterium]
MTSLTFTFGNPRLREKMGVFALYFFLLCGGLWHLLGWFQPLMRWSAGPLMIALGSLIAWQSWQKSERKNSFLLWAGLSAITGFAAEGFGVATGLLFGDYQYGPVLQPQFLEVPLAIGFAWLLMLLSAAALLQHYLPAFAELPPLYQALPIALMMVLFDVVMEPAAILLDYWHWQGGIVPLQNYLAWFAIGFLLAWAGARAGLFRQKLPQLARHAFIAQILYFLMVIAK